MSGQSRPARVFPGKFGALALGEVTGSVAGDDEAGYIVASAAAALKTVSIHRNHSQACGKLWGKAV
ncbi:hypothetical protein [Limimonas halophila]|uniref:hypothetical protein n=1 Tax=Limimonas halophila TaxID=1082479 RepID=UPI00115FE0EB|nr:hypothetical protein [Limimonas halophila]